MNFVKCWTGWYDDDYVYLNMDEIESISIREGDPNSYTVEIKTKNGNVNPRLHKDPVSKSTAESAAYGLASSAGKTFEF